MENSIKIHKRLLNYINLTRKDFDRIVENLEINLYGNNEKKWELIYKIK